MRRALGQKARLERLWDGTLHHLADLPFADNLQDMPDVFTPFRNKARGMATQPHETASRRNSVAWMPFLWAGREPE